MCRVVLFVLVFTCFSDAFAQYNGYKVVTDIATFRNELSSQSSKINTIASNFTQEKILTALTERITSTGTFKFKRSNKVRLQYTKPFTYLMIMNGDKMKVKDDQKEAQVNVRSNKLFQQINRIMIDCIQGTILDSKDFTARVFENEKGFLLEMTPTTKTLKDFFANIVLKIDKADYSVRSIDMNEPSGDQTTMTFTDKKLNVPIDDEVFAF
jgi:outer membrane lipoprotein-sorting protein